MTACNGFHFVRHTVFTEQNLQIYTEYLQNNFRNIKNDKKRTYLEQEKENYSKDCFGNERCKITSRNLVISCHTKFRIEVSRRAKHQGWKGAFKCNLKVPNKWCHNCQSTLVLPLLILVHPWKDMRVHFNLPCLKGERECWQELNYFLQYIMIIFQSIVCFN